MRVPKRSVWVVFCLIAGGVLGYRGPEHLAAAKSGGRLIPLPAMHVARAAHTATLLKNGKVLIAGGMEREGAILDSTELYDPAKRTYSAAPHMTMQRVGHTATLLQDGKVLIVGGYSNNPRPLASAEIYDPDTGTFTAVGSLSTGRGGFTATLLRDGKVLIAGGTASAALNSAELYDPVTRAFSPAGRMTSARSAHTATLLPDGRALLAGGNSSPTRVLDSAELYDPVAGTFTPTGSMTIARYKHAAALLPNSNGTVLIVGGSDSRDWRGRYADAEVYESYRGAFRAMTARMTAARFKLAEAVVTLKDGQVLIAGGSQYVEAYQPAAYVFYRVAGAGQLSADLFYSTATLLPDGDVLIVGGYSYDILAVASSWLYEP